MDNLNVVPELLNVAQLLSELIAIPSPNPARGTQDIARYVSQYLSGPETTIQTLFPDSKPEAHSVVAKVGFGDPVIILHAHIDTVPIAKVEEALWETDPYKATIKEGKLFGKGAVDDKACLAFMMNCFRRYTTQLASSKGTLILIAAAEEEVGGQLGTRYLVEQDHVPNADFIIVGEQTHNRLALAHKGVMRARIQTKGKSVHATSPDRGINAIVAMSAVIQALNNYHAKLSQSKHALVGNPTCNIGTIQGGSTTNAVADTCEITIDRRMIPQENPEDVINEIKSIINNLDIAPASVSVNNFLFSSWFESELNTTLAPYQLSAMKSHKVTELDPIGYLPGSDAKHLGSDAKHLMSIAHETW